MWLVSQTLQTPTIDTVREAPKFGGTTGPGQKPTSRTYIRPTHSEIDSFSPFPSSSLAVIQALSLIILCTYEDKKERKVAPFYVCVMRQKNRIHHERSAQKHSSSTRTGEPTHNAPRSAKRAAWPGVDKVLAAGEIKRSLRGYR